MPVAFPGGPARTCVAMNTASPTQMFHSDGGSVSTVVTHAAPAAHMLMVPRKGFAAPGCEAPFAR